MSGDKIYKLIDMVSRQGEFLGTTDRHASTASELKKEWFTLVHQSLEKANADIDKLEKDQHSAETELVKSLMQIREDLRSEMLGLRGSYDVTLDKLEKRIEKSLDNLSRKVESISIPSIKQELNHEITTLKTEILQIINKNKDELRREDLDPIKTNVNTLMVKVGGIGILGGLAGSGVLMLAIALLKHWLGGSP